MGRDGLDLQLDVFHGGRHHVYLTQVVPDTGVGGWVRASAVNPLARALSAGAHERNLLDVALNPTRGNPLSVDRPRDRSDRLLRQLLVRRHAADRVAEMLHYAWDN